MFLGEKDILISNIWILTFSNAEPEQITSESHKHLFI